ncbi:MAG: NAD-dependent epimerase/dehydratase family protein [Polyangiaceae bacterium]|nr:NAD-dependent epimerase/dehydratase family protein [Polyangiaceae bacterium]
MSKLACVTGATGFVGSYVVEQLLERGYRVRATMRDPSDKKKAAHLFALPRANELLELAAGDLEHDGSFDEAFRGASFVVHSASAVALTAKDPQREIVDVAVNGTKNVVRAALASSTVERIVMTSSVAAVAGQNRPVETVFTEEDWNDTANVVSDAYGTSKVEAERAARFLVQDTNVKLVAMLPSLVLGPVMTEQHLRTSPAVLFELMRGTWPGVPDLHFQVVDVRDLARAHVRALEIPNPSTRYICSSDAAGLRLMAAELKLAFPDTKVPSVPLPDLLMYATAIFDKRLTFGFLKRNLGHAPRFDNRRIQAELGVVPRSFRQSVIDTGESIVVGGYLREKDSKRT